MDISAKIKKAARSDSPKRQRNTDFLLLTGIYLAILSIVSLIACFFYYRQRKESLLSNLDYIYVQLQQDYTDTLDNFWQLYMPLFEKNSGVYDALLRYYTAPADAGLSPLEKGSLSNALHQMLLRDNQVQWIALYAPARQVNYIMSNTGQSLYVLPEDFPYLPHLQNRKGGMEVYGMQTVSIGPDICNTFAFCGGIPAAMGDGRILVGYSASSLEEICRRGNQSQGLPSMSFLLTTPGIQGEPTLLFHSGGDYEECTQYLPTAPSRGYIAADTGESLYVRASFHGNSTSMLSYQVSRWEMLLYSHGNTPLILLIVFAFALFSICIQSILLKRIRKETDIIRGGLEQIGENHLEYRLPTDLRQNDFSVIAESINRMAANLNENIEKLYSYELKQKESELAELQSKFNPHFLYNSLEMLRSRCYQHGDGETAELISNLSGIFRGFIGSKTFVPLPEELAFARKYLTLFAARYRDQVRISYDIDSNVLQYGIIRNLFQPLVENYFVHGFETSNQEENYICIRGKSLNDRMLLFTVEDNGSGMSDEELHNLNEKLSEPVSLSGESYGLKNIHQRLRLFYGEDCGLTVIHGSPKGLIVQLRVLKLTCAEYEAKARSLSQSQARR